MNILTQKLSYLIILASLTCLSFSTNQVNSPDLSGNWSLVIDTQIDGKVQGSNGCTEINFYNIDGIRFLAKYTKCQNSHNAIGSVFDGKFFVSGKGTLVTLNQYNKATDYYATWSGRYLKNNTIQGIWTDIKGNQGEFKLTR